MSRDKEKLKAKAVRYYQKNEAKIKIRRRLYYLEKTEERKKYERQYRLLNKEKIAERKRQYWKKNKKKICLKRGSTQRKISKAQKQAKRHHAEIKEAISLYLLVRKYAIKTFYEKRNKSVPVDEMWRRYRWLANDFEEIQRMKKAA